jgi:hypothetical protein
MTVKNKPPAKKVAAQRKTPEKPVPIATMYAAALHRFLSDVIPFAGKDDTLPMLTAVHIESDGKRLIAVTTDRFTLGVSRLDIDANDPGHADHGGDAQTFNLSRSDVDMLLRVSKTASREAGKRAVSISRNPGGTIDFMFYSGEMVAIKPFDVEFPRWRQLIPASGAEIPRAATGFNADYLARFAKVAGDDRTLRAYTFDNIHGYVDEGTTRKNQQPIIVRIGDSFVGAIMPVRLAEPQRVYQRPDWI